MKFTRDGFIWALLAVAGGAGFLLDHFGIVKDAFPSITPTWHARIELASMAAGWLGAYLRLSPLPLSWDHPLASNDSDTVLSPFNSQKPVAIVLLAAALALGAGTHVAAQSAADVAAAKAKLDEIGTMLNTVRGLLSPPLYRGLTDRAVHQRPPPLALGPAGFAFTDLTFGTALVRVSDEHTAEFNTPVRVASNASVNPWSADSAKFYLEDQWGNAYVFDRAALGAVHPPVRIPSSNVEPSFSFTDPNVLFIMGGPTLHTVRRFSVSSMTSTDVLNLDVAYPNLPLANTYVGGLHLADNDVWAVFFGGAGQDAHRYVHHSTGKFLDTQTLATPFLIHAASLDRSGRYVVLYPRGGDVSTVGAPAVIWDTQTNAVTKVSVTAGGHWSLGYGSIINTDCPGAWNPPQWQFRSVTSPDILTSLVTPVQPPAIYVSDHTSWRNARGDSKQPILSATFRNGAGLTAPWRAWDDEILMVATDGSDTVWRLAHHQSIVDEFWSQPLAAVSPNGAYAIFTTNWGKTLGVGRQDTMLVTLR
jgi:hypothetical protein